jgi:hypothetical protein
MPNSLAMRRNEHDRHKRKVAKIRYANERLVWANTVWVNSLKGRRQPCTKSSYTRFFI